MKKFRDLTIIDIDQDNMLVIACDSSGGIGSKVNDVVKTDPAIVGRFTAQVAVMELLSTGACPISVVNTLGVEMDNTGMEIIKGIKEALEPLNLDTDILLTGSTEENMESCQTFIGITVIGTIEKTKWREKTPKGGDLILCIGIPKVGQEVLDGVDKVMSIEILLELLNKSYIRDILPIGSKGIAYEMGVMASTNSMDYEILGDSGIDLNRTAGPATCVIVATDMEGYKDLIDVIKIPVNIVGKLI